MAEPQRVESRKIQRLGTSSLVVTLPKTWVNRVNLRPGDVVYVVIEGDTLRIVPGSLPKPPESEKRILELTKEEAEKLASHVINCLYVLGYSDVYIKLPSADLSVINNMLNSALRLLGAEAACQGGNTVKFTVLVDDEKIDLSSHIKTMIRNLSLMVEAVKNLASGSGQSLEEVRLLYNELTRSQHFIMRQILLYLKSGRVPLRLKTPPYAVLLASSLLGQAGMIAFRASEYIASRGPLQSQAIIKIAEETRRALDELSRLLATPDEDKSVALLRKLEEIRGKALEVAEEDNGYIVSKLEDFLDVVRIVAMIVLCSAIERKIRVE